MLSHQAIYSINALYITWPHCVEWDTSLCPFRVCYHGSAPRFTSCRWHVAVTGVNPEIIRCALCQVCRYRGVTQVMSDTGGKT